MLKDDATEMNPKIFLFVNPYEVNPGNSQQSGNNCTTSTSQTLPISVKTDSGERSNCEYRPGIKLEMEEFSDLGDLITPSREMSVMDELDFAIADPEGITDLSMHSYDDSQSLKDLVGTHDFRKREINQHQLYIDNQQVILDDIPEDEFSILQQELSNSCANSVLSKLSNNNNNNNNKMIIQGTSLREKATSNLFNFEDPYAISAEHGYANMSSPSEASITPQYSPIGLTEPFVGYKQPHFRQRLSGLNLGVKLFVSDNLNTPDILESVVSLEDDRFNFLRNLDEEQNLKTINKNDLLFKQPLSSPECDFEVQEAQGEPKPLANANREEFEDDDDEDYVPPKRTRMTKKSTESDSDEDYVPTQTAKKRSRRISSVSSDSSKDSSRVSKYRELRDKNNEASRKSRLKRKLKDQEMEVEMQELESENVKLKAKVEELKRMVDNFRSNLFKIMATK